MKRVWLPFRYGFCIAFFVYALNSVTQVVGEPLLAQQTQPAPITTTPQPTTAARLSQPTQANASQTPSSELANLETRVRPSVIWVTAFDPKGNLLRTESGFFISEDGRFVTTAHAIEGAVNAVAKTGDGAIYNVSGVLAASKEFDLAILQAEARRVPFVRARNTDLRVGTGVRVVGSALAGNEGSAREMTIAAQEQHRIEMAGTTPVSAVGSPVVNQNGEVVGVVTATGEKTTARPTGALESLLSRVAADTHARWPTTAETQPTPKPTPKPRLVYAPAPSFPSGVSQSGVSGTGRFRLSFDPNGNVMSVQIIKSTGNPYFDQSAIKTFRQWKSAPSQGWQATVPVTFQTR
jgi:TonB family protein